MLLGVSFPADYRLCLKENHACQALESDYSLSLNGRPFDGGWGWGLILGIDPRESESILKEIGQHPVGLIPISVDGGGNMILLDYRSSEVPSIAYYDAHLELGKNYIFLCSSFGELVDGCYISEDVIELRRREGLYLPSRV